MSKRPSPAMVVAMVALCFAVVGTAVAQDPVAKITKSKVKSIAKKQINKAAAGLTVAKANEATNATNANTAASATTAGTASTVAYAMVNADGTLTDPSRTKNLTSANVSKSPTAGIYCFSNLTFAAKNAVATADNSGVPATVATVRVSTPTGSTLAQCPAGATVRVATFDVATADLTDRPFSVAFQD